MNVKQKRVVLGMSGGVDSSVAAYLLKQQGYDVIGMTLCLQPESDADIAADARHVADQLDIPLHVLDQQQLFNTRIIEYFCNEYHAGRTPNPCVVCNYRIKFPSLEQFAQQQNAQYIATGHYARITHDEQGYHLCKGADQKKEQSYFLFELNTDSLPRIVFPLGDLTKDQVRSIAAEQGLIVHNKPESQEICFIPDNNYAAFLEQKNPGAMVPGAMLDTDGNRVGTHQGIEHYTIGQRRGLGVAFGKPMYVVAIDAQNNAITVGENQHLERQKLQVQNVHWLEQSTDDTPFRANVKIRYNHAGVAATVTPDRAGNSATVTFETPVRAVTPGQAAVFYTDDLVLGGGWIV